MAYQRTTGVVRAVSVIEDTNGIIHMHDLDRLVESTYSQLDDRDDWYINRPPEPREITHTIHVVGRGRLIIARSYADIADFMSQQKQQHNPDAIGNPPLELGL